MLTIKLSDKPLQTQKTSGYVLFCDDTFSFETNKQAQMLADTFYAPLAPALKQRKFTGAAGSSFVTAGAEGDRPVHLIFIGLGSHTRKQTDRLEQARRAAGQVIRVAEGLKINTLAV